MRNLSVSYLVTGLLKMLFCVFVVAVSKFRSKFTFYSDIHSFIQYNYIYCILLFFLHNIVYHHQLFNPFPPRGSPLTSKIV